MYSMVMVMALSGAAATPAWDHGCNGSCHGYTSCHGSCSGSSCHGGHSCFSGFHHNSCSGGCSGSSCSCHGAMYVGCNGCNGCNGCSGCSGCHGSCHGGHSFFSGFKHSSCHGCNGCSGCHGYVACSGCTGCYGVAPAAPAPTPKPEQPRKAEPRPPAASNAAPAKVLVSLPADASLTIDGNVTTSTSGSRTFVSPELQIGKDYVYTLKAEIVRDGKSMSESKTIYVRGGETTEVAFDLAPTVAAK